MSKPKFEQKLGTFSMFKNDRKEKDTHPDMTGTYVDFDGNQFWVSAWRKKKDGGEIWYSGAMKPKEARSAGGSSRKAAPAAEDEY